MPAISSPSPLSHGQQALWFIYREAPDSAAYNMALPLRFTGAVDAAILQRAVRLVLEHHPMLRSVFGESDGVPHQSPQAEISHYWLEVDAGQWAEEGLMAEVQRFSQQPFVLEECAFRATLFQGAEAGAVLLITLHHIAGDAASLSIIGKQIVTLYAAELDGQAVNLPLMETDYADYVRWEAGLINGDKGQRMAAYWQQQLAGELPVLQLPTDRPRPPLQTYNGASLFIELPEELTQGIKALAKAHHCTLFTVLLSAFQVLLHRYSGQTDIWVGIPTSTPRNQPEFSELVGYFVNPMILRADFSVSDDIGFDQLMQQNNRQMLTGLYHQPYPFTQLIEQLQPQRNPAYPPLVQALLALERDDLIPRVFSANHHHSIRLDMVQMDGQFDLAVTFSDGGDGKALLGKWGYNRDLFEAATVERMAGHFEALLTHITANPVQAVGRLRMLTATDIQQLQAWNDTAVDYPQDKTIVDLFEAQVERTPDNIAVAFEDESLTYRQLNAQANRLAHHLLGLAKPDGQPLLSGNPLVAIAVERSLDMIIGLLAILKAGGAYVPIDPSYPAVRIRYMLGDSQAPILLTQSHLTGPLALDGLEHDCMVLCLDTTDVAGQPSKNLPARSTAGDLAYVIYTSGTTGHSKGCQVTQLNVTRLFAVTEDYYHFNDRDVWTLFHSYAFDFSVWEIWGALIYGGCLVIVPYFTSRSPEAFYQLLIEQKVTVLNQTPSAFKQLINVDTQANDLSLRLVIFGGEALDFAPLQPWFGHHGDRQPQLVNMYGITETTVHVTFYPITREQTQSSSVIGKPLPDLNVWLVDANLQPVPIGIPGEILVGGGGVARGYLNRPELTAEKFIEVELFGKTERVYKTGDLARWLPDGNLEFLGRIDHQIKLRGFRIELGEIEAVLGQFEHVKEAVVSLYEADGDKRLVAYVVVSGEWRVASGQESALVSGKIDNFAAKYVIGESSSLATFHSLLAAHLKSRLPDYMIPASFMILDSLPLTPNGKIDRKALPAPELQPSMGFSQPATPTEELLAVLWANVLKREAIGRNDNFFELGGHSLLATQLVSRIRESFQTELPIRAIFEHPQLARLATAIDNASGTLALPPIARQADTAPKVLSFSQQWFWLLSQFDSQDTAHHMFHAWKLAGHLDEDALRQTFSALVARHQSLRLCFPQIGGEVGVAVLPAYDPLTTLDISHLPEVLRGPRLMELQQEAIRQPFALASGPLFRVRLIKAAEQEHYLFLAVHHIIFDAWSTGILLRDWQTLYTALCRGQTPELPALPIDYTDYAAWQRSCLQGEALKRQMDFWLGQLHDAPELLKLPTDFPRPETQQNQGGMVELNIAPELTTKLKQLARQQGCTLHGTGGQAA